MLASFLWFTSVDCFSWSSQKHRSQGSLANSNYWPCGNKQLSYLKAALDTIVVDDDDVGYQSDNFKSGFVSIIGNPNVGKSSILNQLLKQNLSAVSPKPQMTRHRILGVVTDELSQMIFSDTPGLLSSSAYKLHDAMMETVMMVLMSI